MVKNIVFDMGGVLIDFNFPKTLKEYFPEKYHEVLNREVFKNSIWQELDGGTLRSDEAIERILPKIPEETRDLIRIMVNDFYPYMPPFPQMYDFVKRVKDAGYPVYLLSNASPRVFDQYLNIPSLTLMDGFFISALYKLRKPQREIYEAFCNKFSLKPEECFFIDDMPQNIESAKAFGMKGHVFKITEIEALEKALNDEGVFF